MSDSWIVDELKKLNRKIDAQATKGSGDIILTDPDSGVETIIGTLPDGTVGLEQFVGDTTPPPVATTPYVTAQPGQFVVTWDGLFDGGAEKPRDFVHVNVIGHKMNGATTVISAPLGVIRLVTESVLVTLDVASGGELWQFSLEAEDYSGNKAAESPRTPSVMMIDSISSTDQAWVDLNEEVAGKGRTYTQSIMPPIEARLPQNLWIDTGAGPGLYVTKYWDETAGQWLALKDKDAKDAQDTADSKGITIYSSSTPAVSAQLPQNLWIDTTGGININKRWVQGSGWVIVADSRISSTATAVTAAQDKADQAFNSAAAKGRTYTQNTTPPVEARLPQNLWIDTSTVSGVSGLYVTKYWEPTAAGGAGAWVALKDKDSKAAQDTAEAKGITIYSDNAPGASAQVPQNMWIDTTGGINIAKRWLQGSGWVVAADSRIASNAVAVTAADAKAQTALNTATNKTRTYYQNNSPALTGNTFGDTWFDTDYYNTPNVWNGSAWVSAQDGTIALAKAAADSKIETWYAATAPAGLTSINTGDLWIDSDDGTISRWTGSAWVLVNDNGATRVNTKFSDLGIDQTWVDNIESQSDKAITTFFGATTPVGAATGDLWLSGVAGTPMKRYSGTAWDVFEDPNVQNAYQKASDAEALADAKIKTYAATSAPTGLLATDAGDLWINTTAGSGAISRWSGSAWQLVTDNGTAAANKALSDLGINTAWVNSITSQADKAISTFYGAATPTGMAEGDLWLAGTAGTPMKRYTSGVWTTFEDPNVMAAYQKAADAEALADAKVKTFAQSAAPTGLLATDAGDLWIDTDDGKVHRWNGSGWIQVVDNGASAANAALTALGINQTWKDAISTQADKAITTFYGTSTPVGMAEGDLWLSGTAGVPMKRYTSNAWVVFEDPNVSAAYQKAADAESLADQKVRTFAQSAAPTGMFATDAGDLWIDTDDGKVSRYSGSGWVQVVDNGAAAASKKTTTWYQSASPALTGNTTGDVWIDTDDKNKIYVWNGAWTLARDTDIAVALSSADGKNTNYYQTTKPAGGTYKVGDLWIDTDDGNKLYTYSGADFVLAQDLGITAAQASADGKNKVHYATSVASGTTDPTDGNRPFKDGDTWFQRSTVSPFNIIGQWEYVTGASNPGPWVPRKVSGLVLTELDAGTVTVGYLRGENLSATAIDGKTVTGALIQTTNTPVSGASARGIKLTNTELMGFDGTTGNKAFSLTSAGALTLKGEIQSGSTIQGARITGTNGLETSTSTDTGVKISSTGIKAYDTGNNLSFHLDATTGYLEVPGIKTNSLKGDAIETGTIGAEKMTIADFRNLATVNERTGVTSSFPSGQTKVTAGFLEMVSPSQSYIMFTEKRGPVPFDLNDELYYEFTAKATSATTCSFSVWTYDSLGASSSTSQTVTISATATPVSGVMKVTSYKANATLFIVGLGSVANKGIQVQNVKVYRRNGGELIVDGAIDGRTITGALIQSTNTPVTGASARGIKLTSTELMGFDGSGNKNFSLTSAGALTLKGEISSGSTIEGATLLAGGGGIETSPNATTGVKLQNSGIKAYDGTNLTFSVDAATGIVDAPGIRTNSLSGDKITGKSLTADKLVITSTDNLLMEADFGNLGAAWSRPTGLTINATAGRGSLPALRLTSTTATVTALNMNSVSLNIKNKISIGADSRFRGSMWVKSSATAVSGSYQIVGRFYTTATAFTDIVIASSPALAANTWTNVEGIVPATIPSTAIAAEFYLSLKNAASGTTTDIDFASVTRASTGALIVDGAIDGKVVTGATIQTAASGSRIVLDDTALNAWNTAGDNYFNVSDATGVNISSKGKAGYSVQRANYCTNPSMETDISGWTSTHTETRDAALGYVGTSSLKITHTATADRIATRLENYLYLGDYRFSAYVRHNAAAAKSITAKLYWVDNLNVPIAGGTFTGTVTSVATGTWTRLNVATTGLTPANAYQLRLEVVGTAFTSAETLWVDAVMLEHSSTGSFPALGTYFDGNTTDTSTRNYVWANTSNLSISYEQVFNDIQIKTGGNSILVPNVTASKLAPGVGFIPTTPFGQTAGLFSSDGQKISLIEGGDDTQLARVDVGNQEVYMWSSNKVTIGSGGSVDLYPGGGGKVLVNGDMQILGNLKLDSLDLDPATTSPVTWANGYTNFGGGYGNLQAKEIVPGVVLLQGMIKAPASGRVDGEVVAYLPVGLRPNKNQNMSVTIRTTQAMPNTNQPGLIQVTPTGEIKLWCEMTYISYANTSVMFFLNSP